MLQRRTYCKSISDLKDATGLTRGVSRSLLQTFAGFFSIAEGAGGYVEICSARRKTPLAPSAKNFMV